MTFLSTFAVVFFAMVGGLAALLGFVFLLWKIDEAFGERAAVAALVVGLSSVFAAIFAAGVTHHL